MVRHCPECSSEMADDGVWCWCVQAGCEFTKYVELRTGKIDTPYEPPEMCEACQRGDCWDCGMQTWCQCDCPGPDGCYIFDPSEPQSVDDKLERSE